MKSNDSIGKSIPRIGAIERLLGKPVFSADKELDHPLVLKVLPSDRDHARIVKVDTADAVRLKGVVRIFTAEDIPGKNITGIINKDRPLLAEDKVRSRGDAVALVAAENSHVAEKAVSRIRITYEDMPSVHDPEEALEICLAYPTLSGFERSDGILLHPSGPVRQIPIDGDPLHRHGDGHRAVMGVSRIG